MSVLQNGHFQKCGQDSSHQNFSRWNLFFRSYGDHLIVVLLGGFLCITYLPYILHGGFIGDDWDVWSASFFDKTLFLPMFHYIEKECPFSFGMFQRYVLKFVAPVLLILIGIMLLNNVVSNDGATQIVTPNFSAVASE